MSDVKFNSDEVYQKLRRISSMFESEEYSFDTVFCVLGKLKPETPQVKSSTFHLWLLRYEISETIFAFKKDKLVVMASNKKRKYFIINLYSWIFERNWKTWGK